MQISRKVYRFVAVFVGLALMIIASAGAAEKEWWTARGDLTRTGNGDGKPGPAKPKVLWVHRSNTHYVASPAADKKAIYLCGLGAFNAPMLTAFSTETTAKERVRWSKSSPYLKLPLAGSPAIVDGLLVFGDGMHQTDGGALYCLRAETGFPLWQLPVPGELVHLEGAPTVVNDRVYMAGGNAGVFCVDLKNVTLAGQAMDLAAAEAALREQWQVLLAKFEEEKKKDPDFAVPPTEANLSMPMPRKIWQQGEGKWHVDAALAVTGGKVLAASAFLDMEKQGERALYCLSADDGSVLWQVAMRLNPWPGPTIAGDLVVVGSSNIRFDPNMLPLAQGEVLAVNLADGKEKWKRKVTGGVLSPVSVAGGLAVFGSTDGKLRALELATGRLKWSYIAGGPLFAGTAIAGDMVYAGDLNGVVHAVRLSNGEKIWELNLASHEQVKAPGRVYGSPVVQGGRLYVATVNLEQPQKETVVVCIGDGS